VPIWVQKAGSPTTVKFSTPQEIIISDADDSIKIGDGGGVFADVNASRELTVIDSGARTSLASIDAKLVDGNDIGDVTVNNAGGASAVNIQDGGNSITVDAVDLDIRDLDSTSDSVEVLQDTHDDLNANANVQVEDVDVTNTNPLPTSKNPIPAIDIIPTMQFLLDTANKSMDVDGSVTPVVFSFSPASTEVWIVHKIRITMSTSSIKGVTDFGVLSTLANGLLFEWDINSAATQILNVTTNTELLACFGNEFNDGATGNNMAAENGAIYVAQLDFSEDPRRLTDLDEIRATVRDDLTTLDELFVTILASQVE